MRGPEALREAYITPHAVARFRQRIWHSASDEEALAVIRAALANPHSVREKPRQDGTPAWTVRARDIEGLGERFELRLTVVADAPGAPPVVVTVLHGSRGVSRGRNWMSGLRARGVPLAAGRREWRD